MDKNSKVDSLSKESVTCVMCKSSNVETNQVENNFEYGSALLKATITVHSCADCSFEFTGEGSDDIMHEAVCHHLGLLTPREIRGVRGNMSKTEFSHLTGIDEESIRKLERGFMLPNIVKDNFLYLLSLSENFEAIRRRRASSEQA